MTIFIAHADADLAAAEALERHLERRGQFVELETGERGFRPLQRMDAVILLVSKESVFSPWRLRWEKRALDAWADGKLVVVKLDHAFSPVGLRDLPFIDASFEAQREFTWSKVADAVRIALQPPTERGADGDAAPGAVGGSAPPPASAAPPRLEPAPQAPPAPAAKRGGGAGLFLAGFGVVAGLAIAAGAGYVLVAPGLGLDAFGRAIVWAQGHAGELLIAGGVAALLLAAGMWISAREAAPRRPRPKRARAEKPAPAAEETVVAAPAPPANGVADLFISYASTDRPMVTPIVEGVRENGQTVWIDSQGIQAGEGWAGEIVRAIKNAKSVLVMCSTAAFESDHVKREIYLADRYKKRLVPVFLEDAQPPEDFEYFFAGVQWLRLHETPETDRPLAIVQALAAA
ncbi:MAG: TIR domain-containing protein [Alphaproteobacteria bacterium]|nr:TIR domain-containing protein [Alphaproteobacteria bacterium]